MAELFDSEGNAVKAFTPEEVEAQITAKQAEFDAKKADEDKNFTKLREEKEVAEALAVTREEEKNAIIADGVNKEREKSIDALAEGDKDLKEKIVLHVNRFKEEIKTPEDFQRVLGDAYTLAAGTRVPDKLNDVISSAGASHNGKSNTKLPISPEALPVANKLGVTEEDLKTYGGQI